MYKRILSFLMAVAFLMATTGFSVYEHYCGDNLVDKSLYSSDTSCQPEHSEDSCTSTKKMDCCKDHLEFHQLDTKLKNQEWNRKIVKLTALVHVYFPHLQDRWKMEDELSPNVESEAPLILGAEPIYILQRKLVYYG